MAKVGVCSLWVYWDATAWRPVNLRPVMFGNSESAVDAVGRNNEADG